MNQPLSSQEKWLIERELIAREEAKERRGKFRKRVFSVGAMAGLLAATLSVLFGGFFAPLIPKLVWIVCILIYMDFDGFLPSLSKEISLSWHVNPWQESLGRLSETEDVIRGILLLSCYTLSRLALLFLVYSLK